ncbi:hypothetical protein G7047_29385 [Diaphorobacter sp. HDW4A]|uniref:DUF7338 family protein n=1 Tax=Diaphorobacter sp. HDW4A TaxID=2714924 RepID=UPI00140E4F73|nr:hypothetical protein [Diaphorobacter sp. HDW4A]QIL80813.1 hypothetical protein G7047_13530 [Diaphorobacter sp. HDW4A]QIL83591.1 hypothetical protein G7047_29385 [Diaphorobacter sp. HDW4A]
MPSWLPAALYVLAFLYLAWCIFPIVAVLSLQGMPWEHRVKAASCFLPVAVRGALVTLPALLAPIVVPIALLFTKWGDDKLPRLFRWWDNDVSINGDAGLTWSPDLVTGIGKPDRVPEDNAADVIALCYWAKGHHPRSYWARLVWLGWRNRASWLAAQLGVKSDLAGPVQSWGNTDAGREIEGWYLLENAGVYQFFRSKRLGKFCLRTNYGYKVNHQYMGRARLPVVNVTFSLLRWKGEDATANVASA